MDSLRRITVFYTMGAHGLQPVQGWDRTIAGIAGGKMSMLQCSIPDAATSGSGMRSETPLSTLLFGAAEMVIFCITNS